MFGNFNCALQNIYKIYFTNNTRFTHRFTRSKIKEND